jgi:Xaa-Pro dipeptidase
MYRWMAEGERVENMSVYQERREKVYRWMAEKNVELVMFEDVETRRDTSIRWLTGQPGDALLFLSAAAKKSLLVPWDINMANLFASADTVIPYNDFGRQALQALKNAIAFFKAVRHVEIPRATPHPLFMQYAKVLADYELLCRNVGVYAEVEALRAVKDAGELELYRHIAGLTNEVIDLLEENVRSGALKTESDVALFIEAEARKRGCEGTGFETLAAGPGRSFGIHAFPPYTAAPFAAAGLSILDFGLKYAGYTSDVTLTFARDPLPEQEKLLSLVEEAYRIALAAVKNGVAGRDVGVAVDAFFSAHQQTMPHGLGHGIGLEAHESPSVRSASDNKWVLAPGMIFTIEPGLYDPTLGGCRLENDILLTENGAEVLTKSRIVRL